MQFIASTIIPIFGLIAIGAVAARLKLLPSAAADGLAGFVFIIAMPLLLFRTIATADFGTTNPFRLWAAYFGGIALIFAAGIWVGRKVAGMDRRSGVIAGVAASFSNIVLVGVPVAERALGREGLSIMSLLIAVHLPIMAAASTLLVEHAAYRDARDASGPAAAFDIRPALKRIVASIVRNPLIIGIASGVLFRLTGLPLSGPFGEIVETLAVTSGPLALVTLGISLPKYGIGGGWKAPALIAILALAIQPSLVWITGTLAGLPPLWLTVAVITAACPSGVNAYLFALYFKTDARLAATSIVLTTVLAAATLSFWLWVVGAG